MVFVGHKMERKGEAEPQLRHLQQEAAEKTVSLFGARARRLSGHFSPTSPLTHLRL